MGTLRETPASLVDGREPAPGPDHRWILLGPPDAGEMGDEIEDNPKISDRNQKKAQSSDGRPHGVRPRFLRSISESR